MHPAKGALLRLHDGSSQLLMRPNTIYPTASVGKCQRMKFDYLVQGEKDDVRHVTISLNAPMLSDAYSQLDLRRP
jgi:hypothetical protein